MTDLYYDDVVLWSERQRDLLRKVAAGEQVNEAPDWPNIIEEIESVGSEQIHAVRSLLRQALIHMLKAEAWPLSRDAPSWAADAIEFRTQAADRYTASMRQRLDIARIYRQALRALPAKIDDLPPLPLDPVCRVTLDDLLSDNDRE